MKTARWLPAAAAVVSALTFLAAKNSLTDDGYITLDYARNLAVHGEWALIPGHPANTATSPLHVALLAFVTLLTRVSGTAHAMLALGIVNVGLSALLGWAFARLRLPAVAAAAGVAVVLLNPLLLSALGLEVLLIAAMLALLVAYTDRPVVFGVLAGLSLLTRLDLVVFVVLIGLCASEIRRRLPRVIGCLVLVAAPWFVFSWFAFGSAVPDTLVIKQLQRSFGGDGYFGTGLHLMWSGGFVSVLTFVPLELGLVLLLAWLVVRRRVDPFVGLGLGGVAYYLLYSLLTVPPYHWYFVPPIIALGMAGAGIAGRWEPTGVRIGATALSVLAVLAYLPVFVRPTPWSSPPFFGNWASAQDYARVGRELAAAAPGANIGSPGEIGTLAYFCDCAIVDGFSDRGLLGPQIRQRIDSTGPFVSWLFRLNYRYFDWSRQPIPLQYQLRYQQGPGHWQVYSAAKGVGHFTLETNR